MLLACTQPAYCQAALPLRLQESSFGKGAQLWLFRNFQAVPQGKDAQLGQDAAIALPPFPCSSSTLGVQMLLTHLCF